jgi:RimJ/RimL family protein N-acetyltransferase
MIPDRLETERLVLRPWRFEDLPDLLAYATDPEWGLFLPVPQPYTEEDGRRFIASQVLQDRRDRFAWAVSHEGRVIGGVDLFLLCESRIAEMGYSVSRAFSGRGFATEAARAVIEAAFQSDSVLHRVRASADARNGASLRVLEKAGMTREGTLRSDNVLRGVPYDEVWFGVLRSEWSPRALEPAGSPRERGPR